MKKAEFDRQRAKVAFNLSKYIVNLSWKISRLEEAEKQGCVVMANFARWMVDVEKRMTRIEQRQKWCRRRG